MHWLLEYKYCYLWTSSDINALALILKYKYCHLWTGCDINEQALISMDRLWYLRTLKLLHQCLDTDIIGYVFETSVQILSDINDRTQISMDMGC